MTRSQLSFALRGTILAAERSQFSNSPVVSTNRFSSFGPFLQNIDFDHPAWSPVCLQRSLGSVLIG
jgi:hypothetical protein